MGLEMKLFEFPANPTPPKEWTHDLSYNHYLILDLIHSMEGYWFQYESWAPTGDKQIRKDIKALVKMGYLKRDAIFNEATGLISGSGHFLTFAGMEKYVEIRMKEELNHVLREAGEE